MILRPYKKIKELESEIERMTDVNNLYTKREKEWKSKEKACSHHITMACTGCKSFVNTVYGLYCKKDCKCKDREEE